MKVGSLILPSFAFCVLVSCSGTLLIYLCLFRTSLSTVQTHRDMANFNVLVYDDPAIEMARPPTSRLSVNITKPTSQAGPSLENITTTSAFLPPITGSATPSSEFASPYMCLVDADNRSLGVDTSHCTVVVQRAVWTISRRSAEKLIEKGSRGEAVKARTFSAIAPCLNGSVNCFRVVQVVGDCLHTNCQFTWNWRDADVLVFDAVKFGPKFSQLDFPRRPGQRWVMRTQEAPCRSRHFAGLQSPLFYGQFNWSLTFRLDSDIVLLYGKLKRLTSLPRKDYDGLYSGKNLTAAWFVSHCSTQSRRMPYVKRMQKVSDVHIFGRCGNLSCRKGRSKQESDHDQCFPLLSKRYFFYLAFENSICNDYVTEKFFKIFTSADVVPVVRGGADYKRYFPPDTFIDASDFDSPEALGEYLKDLSRDKDRYLRMLREKNKYTHVRQRKWPCQLCDKMSEDTGIQWYPGDNMWTWFVKDQCNNPK
ncbi:unnamed protein product [Lymnaea stagnalis]|uniref:Fucosyltransferase n=1 Tax=Lymnaea stagnalis TaxID=6523 RepID=A0AAV2HLI9_LYMST